jgi:predicted transcriptional regulator
MLSIQRQSMNALMQYLKRKGLVAKDEPERNAPYSLTERGCVALAEMTRRRAA